jgi:hypothetical protein
MLLILDKPKPRQQKAEGAMELSHVFSYAPFGKKEGGPY